MKLVLVAALAALALPAGASAAPQRHTVDLATGRFDGHAVLGLRPAQVRAALGRPDSVHGTKARYVFDWGRLPNLRYRVIFTRRGTGERAVLVALETGTYLDPRLGDLLARTPAALQRAFRSRYADTYRLVEPLRRKPHGLSIGEFAGRDGPLHVSFGGRPGLGTFVTVWMP